MMRLLIISILSLSLFACATPSPRVMSELQQGKRYFDEGYYKRAMHELLPLACDGNAEAEYAVGYMYYYGLGVSQDTDVGYFWIKRSADKHCARAIDALKIIDAERQKPTRKKRTYRDYLKTEPTKVH